MPSYPQNNCSTIETHKWSINAFLSWANIMCVDREDLHIHTFLEQNKFLIQMEQHEEIDMNLPL